MSDQDEEQQRAALVATYRQLEAMGLMAQSSGNVSCRINGGMLISCSGATSADLTPERVAKVHDDGSWDGKAKPSSEWQMHLRIYQHHQAANAVVHTHSDNCVALACNNQPLPGFHYMVGTFGGPDVPCVPYSTFGTEQLAADAVEVLANRAACLLGNHGMICWGSALDAAVAHADRLETLCRQYILARSLGEPDLLTDAQWAEFFAQVEKVGYRKFD